MIDGCQHNCFQNRFFYAPIPLSFYLLSQVQILAFHSPIPIFNIRYSINLLFHGAKSHLKASLSNQREKKTWPPEQQEATVARKTHPVGRNYCTKYRYLKLVSVSLDPLVITTHVAKCLVMRKNSNPKAQCFTMTQLSG